jgi:4-diphosphocytidyl-2-C-methyl-D-erythritol kinase
MAAEAALACRARAKVNLTLKVTGRRADGYHLLESLVVFAGAHDSLALEAGPDLSLAVTGPRAAGAGANPDNLVLRAAGNLAALRRGLRVGHFRLVKRLPAGAGLGGGSSDAAAALRLLARLNGMSADDPALAEAARRTGADVPVCLMGRTALMAGIGDRLTPVTGLARRFAVLVFPGLPTPTRDVFVRLGLPPGGSRADDRRDPLDVAATGNDLTEAALAVQPAIGPALSALERTRPDLARLSGSGSCCFGLYPDCGAAAAAARRIAAAHPDWWVKATVLG